jgi:hypothetical protein
MTDDLEEGELLEPAVSHLSTLSAPHAPKAVLSVLRLAARFPNLPAEHWREAWRLAGLETGPRAVGLFAETVGLPETASPATAECAAELAAQGLLPLAYPAFQAWVAEAGFEAVVVHYRGRAAREPGYLGHGFTVWCSFLELAVLLERNQAFIPWATERFCEFVVRAFPAAPVDAFPLPAPPSTPPEITREELMSAALSRPGYFGHALLSLAALLRHGERLIREEWRAQAWAQLGATARLYPDAEDHERLPVGARAPANMEEMVVALSLGERSDVHNLTLADALCTLWHHFPSPDTRSRLLAIGLHFSRARPIQTAPPAGRPSA